MGMRAICLRDRDTPMAPISDLGARGMVVGNVAGMFPLEPRPIRGMALEGEL